MPPKTKLDRLLNIITDGKTFAMRNAAAKQMGLIQEEFSYDLSYLLRRFYPLFLYPDVDCRRAATLALEELKSHAKSKFSKWETVRPLLSLSMFNLQDALRSERLVHTETIQSVKSADYDQQLFDVSEVTGVAELCQLSEAMIGKLSSGNWHYRHGAVLVLLRTVGPSVPPKYLEDLAVRVLLLLATDRYRDESGDVTKLPVQEPAFHLLARCFMQDVEGGLEKLLGFHTADDEAWMLRVSFWGVIEHMIKTDKKCIESMEWIQERFMETLLDEREDVIAAAMDAVAPEGEKDPIVKRVPDIFAVGRRVWDVLNNDFMDADLASFNGGGLRVARELLNVCGSTPFLDTGSVEHILKMAKYEVLSTRAEAFNLLRAVLESEIMKNFTMSMFTDMSLKVVETIVGESEPSIFEVGLGVIDSLGVLARKLELSLGPEYCVPMCDMLGLQITKLGRVMPILERIAKISTFDEKPTLGGFRETWGIGMAMIVCLHAGTEAPVLRLTDKQNAKMKRDPLNAIMDLFTVDVSNAIDMLNPISGMASVLAAFAGRIVGRQIREGRGADLVDKMIGMLRADEESIVESITEETTYITLAREYMRRERSSVRKVLRFVLTNSVFEEPKELRTVSDGLHALCFVESGGILSNRIIRTIIDILQTSPRGFASMVSHIADRYSNRHPESFLTVFVDFMAHNKLTVGSLEFVDIFLTNFEAATLELLSWVSFFVQPCLRHNADQDPAVRKLASHALAQIVRLMPLDDGNVDKLPPSLHEMKRQSMEYIAPLFDLSKAEHVDVVPAPNFSHITITRDNGEVFVPTIRDYQVDGINWMGFLCKYGMNGVLADDMGLGKTFQCLCIVSNAHNMENNNALSLVVCPGAVASHWKSEIQNFFPQIPVRVALDRSHINSMNVATATGIIVISYHLLRTEYDKLQRKFLFCVLDEGHLIKNEKTKTGQAVLFIRAQHRLLLSGTPIQNDVTELWSLMNFLMPGFLGSRAVFNKRFDGPIKNMFKPDASERATQAGQEALESLHQQVLPFIMRRLKNDVLSQLPPKVIMDEIFPMSREQIELIEILRREVQLTDAPDIDEHAFTKMSRERKMCIHPGLVDPQRYSLDSIKMSAKLNHLRKLLSSRLGFGGGNDSIRNRVLIFAQSTETLDLVGKLVLDSLGATYDKIDGRSSDTERNRIIENFKRDDGKDFLLLTARVGGLGLNLPVANVVIFVENSWNPKEDDQAMDRAHRLGQQRQVTVFNLVTDGTIEVKIMETQKRKRKVIDTIINNDNASFADMNQGNLVDDIGGNGEAEIEAPSKQKKISQGQYMDFLNGQDVTQDFGAHDQDDSGWKKDRK